MKTHIETITSRRFEAGYQAAQTALAHTPPAELAGRVNPEAGDPFSLGWVAACRVATRPRPVPVSWIDRPRLCGVTFRDVGEIIAACVAFCILYLTAIFAFAI